MSNLSKLFVSTSDNNIILTGDYKLIASNRFAKMYLRRNLEFEETKDSLVIKGFKDIASAMEHIKTLAKYIKGEIVYDESANTELQDYQHRESLFADFAKKAQDIRNNEPIVSDFLNFKNALVESLPNRTLYDLQLLSAYHMAFAQNACNFSVPGAGKTSVVYGAFAYLRSLPTTNPKHVDKLLIVGPLSSFGPWENEYEECFGIKPSSTRLISGMSKEQKSIYLH